ncbi:apolipoprotein N-acyltransferase [Streptomyces sp. MAR4 CNX-425]|uniref:apolipoprotein N-acyltransferase n=1 Tax=Streptomyces sp. MAR4 CNX-425 TaxID=3406343 RepID=UPI003B51350B
MTAAPPRTTAAPAAGAAEGPGGPSDGGAPWASAGRLRPPWLAALSRRTWFRPALAAVAGVLLAMAFPPYGLWPLAAVGPAALFVLLRGARRKRDAFFTGTAFGVAFFVPLLWWLSNLGLLPWLLLSVIQALILGALCLAVPPLLRLPAWWLWAAAWWVAVEALRSRAPLGGFPWGRLAFSQADAPTLGWASAGGAPLVSAVVALAAGCLAALVTAPAARRLVPAAALAAAVALGACGALLVPSAGGAGDERANVAVVQGNVPRARSLEEQARVEMVAENHIAATRELVENIEAGRAEQPDLVLWPENATDRDPRNDPYLSAEISSVVDDLGAPVVIGAILDAPGDRIRNAGLLWLPGSGPGPYYAKRQLVPFGEYIPMRSLLGGFGDLQLIPRDFEPGDKAVRLDAGKVRLAESICYEVAYDGQVRDQVRTGANLLAVPTNNATYMRDGNLGEPEQQLAMSRLRAVEHNRSTLVASTTGISAIVTPDGETVDETGPWQREVLTARVPLRTDETLATRVGAAPEWAIVALAVGALGASVYLRRRAVDGGAGAGGAVGDAGVGGAADAGDGGRDGEAAAGEGRTASSEG